MALDAMEVKSAQEKSAEKMDKSIQYLKNEVNNLRAGRANPHILDKITVDYYGTPTVLNQVGNISVPDPRTIMISPWDSSLLKVIEKELLAANLGMTPANDGKVIRLVCPVVTEERRKELVKQLKKMCEDGKVSIRNERRDLMELMKKFKKDGILTEDELKEAEKNIDKNVAKYIENIDKLMKEKEQDIMTV